MSLTRPSSIVYSLLNVLPVSSTPLNVSHYPTKFEPVIWFVYFLSKGEYQEPKADARQIFFFFCLQGVLGRNWIQKAKVQDRCAGRWTDCQLHRQTGRWEGGQTGRQAEGGALTLGSNTEQGNTTGN